MEKIKNFYYEKPKDNEYDKIGLYFETKSGIFELRSSYDGFTFIKKLEPTKTKNEIEIEEIIESIKKIKE